MFTFPNRRIQCNIVHQMLRKFRAEPLLCMASYVKSVAAVMKILLHERFYSNPSDGMTIQTKRGVHAMTNVSNHSTKRKLLYVTSRAFTRVGIDCQKQSKELESRISDNK